MAKGTLTIRKIMIAVIFLGIINGCSSNQSLPSATVRPAQTETADSYNYLIGPGDQLNIFVWRNPDVSGSFIVRPDGKITTSLVEDIMASGKTPTQLARTIEEQLSTYLREPIVTVTVNRFIGPYSEQIRVIGEASQPRAVSYGQNMTLLDVMIAVGGLTQFADGNQSVLVRVENGEQKQYLLNIEDLIKDGDISANVDVLPGDIIVIPEAWF
ncbi:sugar ABC transporter substrate-binding protein [Thalassotalea mangrovi]|uniref:Sugar ABC transporter substrate-binding protein n=2 Tax=Thalassotalea mangrovi TaxID=2572245 RepID=A0A4U1B9D9_9GAMM|nr:XrtA/PEP-CTERM system exopolysaccharide export protein [Thalassotalea mangrovi]TKB46622.1 sugar ABC transporter substrate-binding protein [Thalassotalea mangrovi]